VGAFGGGVLPLDEMGRTRLSSVVDGLDSRGEGFAAIVEHVQDWEGEPQALPKPDRTMVLNQPANFRGELFEVSGTVESVTPLHDPWRGISELFVRDASGDVFGMYVVGSIEGLTRQRIQTPAIFYKTISIEGGDHQNRLYPMFVTSKLVIQTTMTNAEIPTSLLALPLICFVALIYFYFFRMSKSKKRQQRRAHIQIQTQDVLNAVQETSGELPEDASSALAKMYEQTEDDE
jgi:hypothetical protein